MPCLAVRHSLDLHQTCAWVTFGYGVRRLPNTQSHCGLSAITISTVLASVVRKERAVEYVLGASLRSPYVYGIWISLQDCSTYLVEGLSASELEPFQSCRKMFMHACWHRVPIALQVLVRMRLRQNRRSRKIPCSS